MNLWLILAVNSVTLGGLLFLLSAGFSLIFGLMRIPNLMHGSLFMLGAYFGVTLLGAGGIEFLARRAAERRSPSRCSAALIERFLLRRLAGQQLAAGAGDARPRLHHRRRLPDGLDRRSLAARDARRICAAPCRRRACTSRSIGWSIIAVAVRLRDRAVAAARLDAARRHDPRRRRRSATMARVVGIRVSQLFTLVFCLGAGARRLRRRDRRRRSSRSIPASTSTCCRSR